MFEADLEVDEPSLKTDPSSLAGAQKLADKINAVWAARGITANAHPVFRPFNAIMRAGYYAIESDLIVGRQVRAEAPAEIEL
jgi:hypothetical protein